MRVWGCAWCVYVAVFVFAPVYGLSVCILVNGCLFVCMCPSALGVFVR